MIFVWSCDSTYCIRLYRVIDLHRWTIVKRLFLAVFAAKLLNDGLTCLCLSIPGVVAMSLCVRHCLLLSLKIYPPRTYMSAAHKRSLLYHMICLCCMGGTEPRLCIHSTHMSRGYTFTGLRFTIFLCENGRYHRHHNLYL